MLPPPHHHMLTPTGYPTALFRTRYPSDIERDRHVQMRKCSQIQNTCTCVVDREKLRAVLLINPTKSTLLPILNRGEVGPKKNQGRPPVSGSTGNRYFFNLLQSNFPASHLALNHLNQT